MTREQAAYYFAGLLDGEGSVSMSLIKGRWWTRSVSITNSDYALIEAAKECLDILGVVYREKGSLESTTAWNQAPLEDLCHEQARV